MIKSVSRKRKLNTKITNPMIEQKEKEFQKLTNGIVWDLQIKERRGDREDYWKYSLK